LVSLSHPPALNEACGPITHERLALRDQASQPLLNNGWILLYTGLTDDRASVTLLDPSESLQISLQIPLGDTSPDWDLLLEACHRQLSLPLRDWLASQGIEGTSLSRLTGAVSSGDEPLKLSNMLQVARWLEGPIQDIESMAEASGCQLVLHLAGLGPNS